MHHPRPLLPPCRLPTVVMLAMVAAFAVLPGTVRAAGDAAYAKIEALINQGQAEEALQAIEAILKSGKTDGQGLLLRSTARIMTGDTEGGYKDLERAVKLDPTLRQGWLNLAGLAIAESDFAAAEKWLEKAQALDPKASDSYLNLGAVALLRGQRERANEQFRTYLDLEKDSAEASYLVAANYAIGGSEEAAVEHLRRAIALDERTRLRARSDGRFAALASPSYHQLLTTDSYQPPADAHTAAAAFREPYSRRDPQLLYAVVDALKELKEPYDPQIEATEDWAIVWSEMRIKVSNQTNGTGVVSVSAPADRFTTDIWSRRSQELFRAIFQVLENREPTLSGRSPR